MPLDELFNFAVGKVYVVGREFSMSGVVKCVEVLDSDHAVVLEHGNVKREIGREIVTCPATAAIEKAFIDRWRVEGRECKDWKCWCKHGAKKPGAQSFAEALKRMKRVSEDDDDDERRVPGTDDRREHVDVADSCESGKGARVAGENVSSEGVSSGRAEEDEGRGTREEDEGMLARDGGREVEVERVVGGRMRRIDRFRDEYRFLGNAFLVDITTKTGVWPSVEHLFHASKTKDKELQEKFRTYKGSLAGLKMLSRSFKARPDWDEIRVPVMNSLLAMKFVVGSPMAAKLLATGDAELIEGNWWHNEFWGVCACEVCGSKGLNMLGKALMSRRLALGGPGVIESIYRCQVCHRPVWMTPSGRVCVNGHGGVEEVGDPE